VRCQAESDRRRSQLLKFLVVGSKKPNGNYELLLDSSAADAVKAASDAEKKVDAIESDCKHYKKLLEPSESIESLISEQVRMSRAISDSDLAYRHAVTSAMKTHAGLDVLGCEELPAVAALIEKRNLAKEKYEPQIDALKKRIKTIRELESKYQSS